MKRALVVLMLCFLVGCSTKMSYYFLDWAIEWQLDDYVTLDRNQQHQFDVLLDNFLKWHRREELNRYAEQLTELKTQLQQGTLTPALWAEHMDRAQAHWFRLFDYGLEGLLPLIQSFNQAQVDEIIAQLRKDEAELAEEYQGKTQEQLVKESDKSLQEQAEKWLGKLSERQKALIHNSNANRLATLDMWLEYRHEWLRQFEQALNQRQDAALLRCRMTLLMTSPQRLKSEAHQQAVRQNTENFGRLVLDIYQDLSDKQRRKLWREYDDLIEDLRELAADAQ
ncbi:DUF6279 family lipoprotein [Shewanella cyperi]|uniref:DUF6279 family lipoprotein n=1 Tax=Shewanella cyperi TaxID=2814292 RepID=UPI001A952C93|nr:DUF6279 family lipoprotein [Shewanella cyperi]QSX42168.1 hypothetical protein JYB84_07105 [Shewanella cyperi]